MGIIGESRKGRGRKGEEQRKNVLLNKNKEREGREREGSG